MTARETLNTENEEEEEKITKKEKEKKKKNELARRQWHEYI